IAEAGRPGAVTIATNMAGRGTDIILGEGVAQLGGLFVIGTERHESRRIDNQLRGRSGRQGDTGASKFFLSWEDELMRRFNNKANQFIMEKFVGDEAIYDPRLTKIIGKVQKRVEGFNYDIRKQLLEYDDVLNQQRKTIYAARMRILRKENVKDLLVGESIEKFAQTICDDFQAPKGIPGETVIIDFNALERFLFRNFNKAIPFTSEERKNNEIGRNEFYALISNKLLAEYEEKEKLFSSEQMRELERWVMLQTVDSWWKDHLLNIDHLKDGIGLRGYAQRDPLQEYKREAFELFKRLVVALKQDTLSMIFRIQPNLAEKFIDEAKAETQKKALQELKQAHAEHEAPAVAVEHILEEESNLERKKAHFSEV
ncbi:MAG: preprotein translocase subunit SecA, partial [Bdellovibrionota bacterium]